ncbi:MAG: homogentisate 1,2-dioxygenase [Acidimicrobiales bacterium]
MPYFMQAGDIPRKRFSQFRDGDGRLFSPEVFGEEGFSSDMSLLYHQSSPSVILDVEEVAAAPRELAANHPLRPRLFDTTCMKVGGDVALGRQLLVGNDDVLVSFVAADTTSPLYRNAAADELVYVHEGAAVLETLLGTFEIRSGDYVVLPKGTTARWVVERAAPLRGLVFETVGHIRFPKRYLSEYGQLLQVAPFCELDIRRPQGPFLASGEAELMVRTRHGVTRYTFANHPFDVVGWFGCNYPWVLNIEDFSPTSASFHRPPPVHQVFEASNLVFCNFVPRVLDYDPRALPIPSFHSNADSDELIFYAEGNFFSRGDSGIGRASMTLHPAGHVHGPHPGSLERAADRVGQRTEEYAVMLDTFRPLGLAAGALDVEQPNYIQSWNRNPR